MKTISKISAICLLIVFLISCTKDEKVIDTQSVPWKLLVASSSEPYKLTLYEQPSGNILISDVYSSSNNGTLGGKVEKIAEFGKYLFLFIPSKNTVKVLGNDTYKELANLDYSSTGKIPTGICFPNATDAYITFGNDSTVELIDLTNFKSARTIKVGKNPISIASAGNQIYVVNSTENYVSVIDSRTHDVAAKLNVPNVPYYVDFSADGQFVSIISLGNGKIDSSSKSAAMVTVFNVNTRTMVKSQNLGTNAADAIAQIPKGLSVTDKSWGFIPTKTNLFRLNSKTGDFTNIAKFEFESAVYNYKRDELIVIRKKGTTTEIYTADPISASLKEMVKLQDDSHVMIPLSN